MKRLFLAAAALAASAPAAATITVDPYRGITFGSVSGYSVYPADGTGQTDNNQAGYNTVYSVPTVPLTATSSVAGSAVSANGSASASARNTVTAALASTSSGTISFVGEATAISTGESSSASANSGYFFQYGFDTDQDTSFDLTYALSGPQLGCCGNSYSLQDTTTGYYILTHTLYGTDLTGTDSASLLAGRSYLLTISKGEYCGTDAPCVYGSDAQSFTHDDRFSFQIGPAEPAAAVPEPATWGLMIGGFGMVGGVLRRRRAPALRAPALRLA